MLPLASSSPRLYHPLPALTLGLSLSAVASARLQRHYGGHFGPSPQHSSHFDTRAAAQGGELSNPTSHSTLDSGSALGSGIGQGCLIGNERILDVPGVLDGLIHGVPSGGLPLNRRSPLSGLSTEHYRGLLEWCAQQDGGGDQDGPAVALGFPAACDDDGVVNDKGITALGVDPGAVVGAGANAAALDSLGRVSSAANGALERAVHLSRDGVLPSDPRMADTAARPLGDGNPLAELDTFGLGRTADDRAQSAGSDVLSGAPQDQNQGQGTSIPGSDEDPSAVVRDPSHESSDPSGKAQYESGGRAVSPDAVPPSGQSQINYDDDPAPQRPSLDAESATSPSSEEPSFDPASYHNNHLGQSPAASPSYPHSHGDVGDAESYRTKHKHKVSDDLTRTHSYKELDDEADERKQRTEDSWSLGGGLIKAEHTSEQDVSRHRTHAVSVKDTSEDKHEVEDEEDVEAHRQHGGDGEKHASYELGASSSRSGSAEEGRREGEEHVSHKQLHQVSATEDETDEDRGEVEEHRGASGRRVHGVSADRS